jgi:predicted deacetylase
MSAQYLIRFDDFCPTMNWDVWNEVEKILLECNVHPILSVIPDNQDENLKVSEARKSFWEDVRAWQARGWTIGLHGYQHLYETRDAGLIGLNDFSEFSGLRFDEQSGKIQRALEIFYREEVKPAVWVAPGHSFDETTVKVLRSANIHCISDGLHIYPHVDSLGILWVPQQFWRFRPMPFGVWTVCCHVNRWTARDIALFRSQLQRFRAKIADFPDVIASYSGRQSHWFEAPYARLHLAALKAARFAVSHDLRSSS